MHEISELEKRWFRYKLKRFLRVGLISLSGTLVAFSIYFVTMSSRGAGVKSYLTNLFKVEQSTEITSPKSIEVATVTSPENNKTLVVAQKTSTESVALEPIIPVIDMAKEESIKHTRKSKLRPKRTKPSHATKHNSKLVKAKPNSYLTAKELSKISKVKKVVKEEPHVPKKIKFQTTRVNYIATMEKKFSKYKSARDAILIAKAYYRKGNYAKAESWALSANKLDKKSEESWLLFAKSKAKLGKKQEAINILASYYKKSKSAKAKALIGQIRTGKF